ncbi:hypothetical protein U5640_07850 [Streptomyces sp. SS7]|uniref:hypothetical protein n=1 Tax=Streptomyces sp. SS7 TaxID=3108485 RepID=UPI0030EF9D23
MARSTPDQQAGTSCAVPWRRHGGPCAASRPPATPSAAPPQLYAPAKAAGWRSHCRYAQHLTGSPLALLDVCEHVRRRCAAVVKVEPGEEAVWRVATGLEDDGSVGTGSAERVSRFNWVRRSRG